MFIKVMKEGELIVKMPRELMNEFEKISKQRGFKNSREFLANFVRKQFALFYKIDKNDFRLKDIH